jgi:hypothetical protein
VKVNLTSPKFKQDDPDNRGGATPEARWPYGSEDLMEIGIGVISARRAGVSEKCKNIGYLNIRIESGEQGRSCSQVAIYNIHGYNRFDI